jgi:hypothetical protein
MNNSRFSKTFALRAMRSLRKQRMNVIAEHAKLATLYTTEHHCHGIKRSALSIQRSALKKKVRVIAVI